MPMHQMQGRWRLARCNLVIEKRSRHVLPIKATTCLGQKVSFTVLHSKDDYIKVLPSVFPGVCNCNDIPYTC